MSKTTQIKILLLLFTYSIVLLHSAIPHCHAQDSHSYSHTMPVSHHTCSGHHDEEEHDESHQHEVCNNESLHGNYLKSESLYSSPVHLSDADALPVFEWYAFQSASSLIVPALESVALVRSCYIEANILRGPPAC